MYRPVFAPIRHHHQSQGWQETVARLLVPLTLWIFAVVLRYGYYEDYRMVLGPSSSRLVGASSLFVKQVEVRDDKKGVLLYGFPENPELSLETNWSVSNYVSVGSYGRKGYSLWLNKGSSIRLRWNAQTSIFSQIYVSLVKGTLSLVQTPDIQVHSIWDLLLRSITWERRFETLQPDSKSSVDAHTLNQAIDGSEAKYSIEEDDRYYIGIINSNPRSIIMTLSVNVLSKMYDTTKAKTMCSTISGSCRLNLPFPNSQFVVVTTPPNGDLGGWYVELSFVARFVTYVAILGFIVIIIFLMWNYFGACDAESHQEEFPVQEISETYPLLPEKTFRTPYGTGEEDEESGSSSSSEDLYDGKICVICYDMPRNCFFVPCGHCATCYDCAQRIMEAESKVCPICRRLIHKVRKLIIP
ncbi:hypothetical protein RJ639_005899 [Escallonia herrerae]|uniref:RING-type domain-containing protein n=1 Tax=Escallonia herrerae TaxID=1293975 RepID=A0AA88VZ52_9ASTE|nr:hypothetical protein RJ639_005899 [Escallonia herrerae]